MQLTPQYRKFILSLFTVLLVGACSTEKDAIINKGYHNMTARYNGYYNAGVIIDESLDSYRNGFTENYNDIIPIDLYPTAEDAPNLYPELEDAIERCSKVIVRHSMPNPQRVKNKKNENCRWIDDNWLVIGQAYYIKREYDEAKEKLKYVSEADFYRGEASVYEARIWLAKTHTALGEYSEAKRVLAQVEQAIERTENEKDNKEKKKRPSKLERQRAKKNKDKKDNGPAPFPKKLKIEYEVALAELYLAQEDYKKATTHLENAVKLGKNRKRRARHMFALAQLYAKQGNGSQASYYYKKVARSNAPYEMRFKAKIFNALSASGNSEELRKELHKMLKDGKNLEYKDQIYYALAELDMKQPDVDAAKANYTRSVLWSINNDRQKGVSYLSLADIHFDEKDYLKAQKYYDSCVQVLPKDYEGYEKLKNKAEGLSDLVVNYETVQFEDSVQTIAQMGPKERKKFLEKTIKEIEAEEERKRIEAEQRLLAQQERVNQQQGPTGTGGKKWYFSNPKLVASGFNDFRTQWGQRPLEDNWRRANKASFDAQLDENGEPLDSAAAEGLTVEQLLVDIPLTPAMMDSSNNRIMNSLYNLGIIYKEQLKEENEAIAYFQEVIDRKIEHPKVLPSLYQLYLIFNKRKDPKANQYKATIISDYPKSEIAQILQDPDYLKKKELKDREELNEYSGTMRNYRRRSYGLVITKCNQVINEEPENQFLHKYYLLKAFAISKINAGNVQAISEPLQALYDIAPNTEEGQRAKMYLDKLKKGEDIGEPGAIVPVESPYKMDKTAKHFFMVAVPKGTGKVSETKIKMSNFNGEFYKNDALTLQDAPLGADYQVLIIRSFNDSEKAKAYLASVKSEKAKDLIGTTATDFELCLISTKNFAELFKNKDLNAYLDFYKANY